MIELELKTNVIRSGSGIDIINVQINHLNIELPAKCRAHKASTKRTQRKTIQSGTRHLPRKPLHRGCSYSFLNLCSLMMDIRGCNTEITIEDRDRDEQHFFLTCIIELRMCNNVLMYNTHNTHTQTYCHE